MRKEIEELIRDYEERVKSLWKGEYCGCWDSCNCRLKEEGKALELETIIYDLKELINVRPE